MARAVLAVGGSFALTACFPVGPPQVAPAQPIGPTLAFVVSSQTNERLVIGYEFQDGATGGGGEGEVACENTVMRFGEVSGSYSILVGGEEVASGQVPRGVAAGMFMVFRIDIGADGSSTVVGPNLARQVPDDPPPAAVVCP